MLIHFIAFWFFIHAFEQLSALHDPSFFDDYKHNGTRITAARISKEAIGFALGSTVGLLAGLVISLLLSLKYKWYWLNSVIVFVLIILLKWFSLLGWEYLKHIVLAPGNLFESIPISFLANGLIMLAIGLSLFFMRWSIRFINGSRGRTNE